MHGALLFCKCACELTCSLAAGCAPAVGEKAPRPCQSQGGTQAPKIPFNRTPRPTGVDHAAARFLNPGVRKTWPAPKISKKKHEYFNLGVRKMWPAPKISKKNMNI